MIYEHAETGIRIVVAQEDDRIDVTTAGGEEYRMVRQSSLVTESGQPIQPVDGDPSLTLVNVYTNKGVCQFVRVE